MLSDESSSDSETGRFKGQTKSEKEQLKSSSRKEDSSRSLQRGNRNTENDRFRREFDRKKNERDRGDRDRWRHNRQSPARRRHSRERSPRRVPREQSPKRGVREQSPKRVHREQSPRRTHREQSPRRIQRELSPRKNPREQSPRNPSREKSPVRRHLPDKNVKHSRERSPIRIVDDKYARPGSRSRDRVLDKVQERQRSDRRDERSRPDRPLESRRNFREEIKQSISNPKEKSYDKYDRQSKEKDDSSPEYKPSGKRSVIHKPEPPLLQKRKSDSPIIVEEHKENKSEVVQPGSYYSMIPAVVKEKSEDSSEIDSSDDERLRAKLLNKGVQKSKKKKHRKKHKRKVSKSKEKEPDTAASVEVSSTTDIHEGQIDSSNNQPQLAEVSSTQKNNQKESSEEGEISTDDSEVIDIDPNDLRHKLKRTVPKLDVCGPALPPHLRQRDSISPNHEGPALPPHLKRGGRNIGPAIPEGLRKELAERKIEDYMSSSDEDGIGPLPVGVVEKWSEAHHRLEERALSMKMRKLEGHSLNSRSDVKSREQWMLELPEGKAKYLGVEARTFRAKAGPDMSDRSSWTDTPEEKARKAAGIMRPEDAEAALKEEARQRYIAERDEEKDRAVRKHKKKHKREESLLEMHQKKLKKKKKKDDKDDKKERRPFSRDVDLQANRFDDAQRKSIIKKSQELNTRFSRGEAKYL